MVAENVVATLQPYSITHFPQQRHYYKMSLLFMCISKVVMATARSLCKLLAIQVTWNDSILLSAAVERKITSFFHLS